MGPEFNRPATSPNGMGPLASNDPVHSRAQGTVLSYNPKTKVYRVRVLNHGDKFCRAMAGSIQTAYPEQASVIVSRINGTDWVIEGEIDPISWRTGPNAGSARESQEDVSGDLNGELRNRPMNEPSYRPVDETGRAEPAVLPGDTLIQSRAALMTQRSRIKLSRSGDIILRAANAVSVRLSRVTGVFRVIAKKIIRKVSGYQEKIQLTGLGRTFKEESLISRVTLPDFDVVERAGWLGLPVPGLGGIADTGKRITTGTVSVELDKDTGTIRIVDSLTATSLELGSFVAENSTHPVSAIPGAAPVTVNGVPVVSGIRLRSGDKELVVSPLAVHIKQTAQTVTVSDTEISLVKGKESLVLSDAGLLANVSNFVVNASAQATIKAPIINLNN